MASADRSDNRNTPTTTSTSSQTGQTSAGANRQQSGSLSRRDPWGHLTGWASPFGSLFQRWNDEMDRVFDDFGFGRNVLARGQSAGQWSPQIEVRQRGNELLIRADLPGMKKEDVNVEIRDDAVILHGERKEEHEEEHEGWYRSERSYGSFHRTIPLPEGAIADSAKASFKNGVLEITLQTPPKEVSQGRKVTIE
jgi:HSP20 family protein